MKLSWLNHIAIVASLIFGTAVTTAHAGNGRNFSVGNKVFSSGNSGGTSSSNSKPAFTRSTGLQGLGLSTGKPLTLGNGNAARLQTYKPQILQGLGTTSGNGATGGTVKLNPRLSNGLGIGTSNNGPVWTGPLKTDLFGKGGITKIPGLGGIGPVQPGGGGVIDPGIGNGQPGGQPGNGNGNGNKCWFPPINIGLYPGNGCYPNNCFPSNCYPCYPNNCYYPPIYTYPVVQTQVVQPVVVTAHPVAEKLLQIPVGTTLNFDGKDLGDKAGQVVLMIDKLSLGVQVNEWKIDKVTATLPMLALSAATKAEIFVVKADGQIASNIKVELLPAQPPKS